MAMLREASTPVCTRDALQPLQPHHLTAWLALRGPCAGGGSNRHGWDVNGNGVEHDGDTFLGPLQKRTLSRLLGSSPAEGYARPPRTAGSSRLSHETYGSRRRDSSKSTFRAGLSDADCGHTGADHIPSGPKDSMFWARGSASPTSLASPSLHKNPVLGSSEAAPDGPRGTRGLRFALSMQERCNGSRPNSRRPSTSFVDGTVAPLREHKGSDPSTWFKRKSSLVWRGCSNLQGKHSREDGTGQPLLRYKDTDCSVERTLY